MATELILLSDGTDDTSKAVVHTVQESIELGPGDDGFADAVQGWQWITYANGGGTHTGGKLDLSHAGSASYGIQTPAYEITGDFSMQFDFDSFAVDSGTDDVILGFQLLDSSSVGVEHWRFKKVSSATDEYFCRELPSAGIVEVATTDTNGKLRVDRYGDDFITFYWDIASSEWVIMATYSGVTTGAIRAKIWLRVDAATTGSAKIDNVQFNNGGFYNTTSPSPNAIPWNTYDIGLTMDMSTIDIFEYGAGSQTYQYAINNGALNGSELTLAQLQAESDFVVSHSNSLKIQTTFVSNGTQTSGVIRL